MAHLRGTGAAPLTGRDDRFYPDKPPDDVRTPAQRDRDRILYTPAFRRLADVTQVVAADEGHVFHNRLTHSLEVAQFGRRLAQKLLGQQPALRNSIDPDVVEAACLAHDLGHPPFGHVGEQELDELVTRAGLASGFEGNAQSFRIVAKLAPHTTWHPGLSLTRATLNAILKYPWERHQGPKELKWGAYDTEQAELKWARTQPRWKKPGEHDEHDDRRKSPEATLMDWADDVTHAVHDAVDFYRAGLAPLDRLASRKDDSERNRFLDEMFDRHQRALMTLPYNRQDAEKTLEDIVSGFPIPEPYHGTGKQDSLLAEYTANQVARYMKEGVELQAPGIAGVIFELNDDCKKEVFFLQQLTWHYVILGPALATQQHGQRRIIRDLFHFYQEAADKDNLRVFPSAIRERMEKAGGPARIRIIADYISGMGERQAITLHRTLTGASLGSVLDRVAI